MSHPWSLRTKLLGLFACFVICVQATNWAAAEIITRPSGAGNYYYLAFVTSTSRLPNSDDIDVYNQWVTDQAKAVPQLAGLRNGNLDWYVIGSTDAVDARDNIEQTAGQVPIGVSAPVYDLNGNRIADDLADLWDGSIQNKIQVTELDTTNSSNVYTGTDTDGTEHDGYALGDVAVERGSANFANSWWIKAGTDFSPSTPRSFYAISGVMPEPGTLSLAVSMALVSAGGAWYRRRKRRRNNL